MARILVTGANRGIGLELCRQYKARGDEVIGVCRRSSEGLDGLGIRVEAGVDVSSQEEVDALATRLGELTLDVLINNAGILRRNALGALDFGEILQQFEINALGPLRVTQALLSRLTSGSKVGLVTSRMGSLADNTSGGSYGYRMSKAALNMAGISLAHDLKERGIAVAILHPGFVRTDMTGGQGMLDTSESVQGLIARMDGLSLDNSGTFWHTKGEVLPW